MGSGAHRIATSADPGKLAWSNLGHPNHSRWSQIGYMTFLDARLVVWEGLGAEHMHLGAMIFVCATHCCSCNKGHFLALQLK